MNERRDFLRAAGSGLLILRPGTVFGSQANSAVEIGIVGAGGRGNWIADLFIEHSGARVVAIAEPFEDRRAEAAAKYRLAAGRAYKGREGHRELANSKLDAVVIESPPFFHPEQAEAAVTAGKHVFLAKPVAVDVPGCKRIMAAGAKAKGKLSFLVDFQTRARDVFQEAARRVHRGDIGDLVLGHVYYHAGRLNPHASTELPAEMLAFRNWLHDRKLSGDIIVEQNIHVIDAANWYLQAHPLRAQGTCGRKARVDVGDTNDHFIVTYWYDKGIKVDFSSAQFLRGYGDLCIRVYGSKGTLDSHYNGKVEITGGDNRWSGTAKDDTFTGGAVANLKAFVDSIRTGKPINNADHGAESTLSAILGRMAAYTGKPVTWDEMLRSNETWEANVPV